MLDNFHERDGGTERERPVRSSDDMGPLSDREVPLAPVASNDVINRWLDGELAEPTNLRGDAARSVEFWRRLGEETDKRRQVSTPAHLSAKIMAALPPVAPRVSAEPWWKKDVALTPMVALAVGAGLFMLGVIFAQTIAR
jgi:hypothetical protein